MSTQGQSNLGGEHLTKEGQPDMRFKENQEGEPYQKEAGQRGGQVRQGEGQGDMEEESRGSQGTQSTQGQSNLGGEHLTKEGQPDMRFKENQEGEPYQQEAGQKGGQARQGSGQGGNQGGMEEESTGTQGQSSLGGEHTTKEGKPDMRFAENQEGEPYQREAGQKGGQVRQGEGQQQGVSGQS